MDGGERLGPAARSCRGSRHIRTSFGPEPNRESSINGSILTAAAGRANRAERESADGGRSPGRFAGTSEPEVSVEFAR